MTNKQIIFGIMGVIILGVGYYAISPLFLILVTWQIPHAFAIALYRLSDYTAACIPVLPVARGIIATLSLSVFGRLSYMYFYTMMILGILWLMFSCKGFFIKEIDERRWARKMFFLSLIILMAWCGLVIGGGVS